MQRISTTITAIAILAAVMSCSGNKNKPAIASDKALEARVEKTLKEMDLDTKVGQMVQLNINLITSGNDVDPAKMEALFGRWKIGSILNVFQGNAQTREKTADIISKVQEASMKYIGIPTIYGLDMIHGATYLSDGTFFPQEVNLAATFDTRHASNMGNVMAYETRAAKKLFDVAMLPWR